jgi:hypothetical protein
MARVCLYRRALGPAYSHQSPAGHALHDAGTSRWTGACSVDGAETAAARLVAAWFRLPRATDRAPIAVDFLADDGGETWTREIGGRTMRSRQFIVAGKPAGWIVERFGVFDFDLELQAADRRLRLILRGVRCCGLPLPRPLWPAIEASESEEEGRFCFDVRIEAPFAGRLVRYRGWLTDR